MGQFQSKAETTQKWGWGSLVSIVTGLRPGVRFPSGRSRDFSLFITPRPALELTPMGTGGFSPRIKRPEREADRSSSYDDEI
jgi:hypothetical protein